QASSAPSGSSTASGVRLASLGSIRGCSSGKVSTPPSSVESVASSPVSAFGSPPHAAATVNATQATMEGHGNREVFIERLAVIDASDYHDRSPERPRADHVQTWGR